LRQQGPQIGSQQPGTPPTRPGFIGNLQDVRTQRREHTDDRGRTVVDEPGGRQIVRDRDRTFIQRDEGARFRRFDPGARVERRGNENFSIINRPGNVQIITVTGDDGRLLRRMRRFQDGREVVLIDNRRRRSDAGFFLNLGPPRFIPPDHYIVEAASASPDLLFETLEAPPVEPLERAYSLEEIRHNVNLRARMPRIDLDTITFETGSWEIMPEQVGRLEAIADAIKAVLARHPDEIFLIEGHTDTVGLPEDNLTLSDRRAESVAAVLAETYGVPPENLEMQGYGEQYLKVPVEGPQQANRRVTVVRISPLLAGR
jgi:outer membrane protein OmpA-like peptidoglycan-associated protein